MEAIPLSLYVHLPWCVRKCPYCDFNSHALTELPETAYIDALIDDLETALPSIWGRPVQSIFLGGGTPSLFSPQAIARLISELRTRLRLSPNAEITMEANPGTAEQDKFRDFRAAGINRLSLGIQSFNDAMLTRLGRIHGAREAHQAVEIAIDAGFDNFNLDLMFGLPGQSARQAFTDLQTAIQHEPSHISYYQLTIEPNTFFHQSPPTLPMDDDIWEMQLNGVALLETHGYQRYEVSAYARNGKTCHHNRNYWEFGDYLGIGAGAHSKITHLGSGAIHRFWKHRQPTQYMRRTGGSHIGGEELLTADSLPFEFMLNALRLTQGVNINLFPQRTFLPLESIQPTLRELSKDGLLDLTDGRLVATAPGQQFLNDVISRFLPDT